MGPNDRRERVIDTLVSLTGRSREQVEELLADLAPAAYPSESGDWNDIDVETDQA